MKNNNLIFDLGFHNGDDSDYYLAKGFNVVAVEANPTLAEEGRIRFKDQIATGQLVLINKAISDVVGSIEFYIHKKNSDWSSCYIDIVRSDGSYPDIVIVETTTLVTLYETYGIPHYVKVDLEGCDVFTAKQVFEHPAKPDFISFETSKRDYAEIFSYLYVAGYRRFQLVNQANNPNREALLRAHDGNLFSYEFTQFSSGLFGENLPKDLWLSFDDALTRYIKYKELKQLDSKELGLGWLDIHASMV
jgi:FkbM family methyltransferase